MMNTWDEVRQNYVNQWVLVEAIEATNIEQMREIHAMLVINSFNDFQDAWLDYVKYHRAQPKRELYVLHTRRERLEIEVARSIGVVFRR